MKKLLLKSVLAGVLIGLAACIYVKCTDKLAGSILFSIGLIGVILLQAYLYTGKIGYVDNKQKLKDAMLGLVVNLSTAFCVGLIFRLCNGEQVVMAAKIAKNWYQLLFDGIGCGALIYLAVELYKKSNNILVVILPVMAFILAGFEHCIADAAYYGMCESTWQGLLAIILVIIGNTIGSLLIHLLQGKED